MVTMDVFPFQGKTHMVEPGIEPGTSWLVVRSSNHQVTRLVVSKDVNITCICRVSLACLALDIKKTLPPSLRFLSINGVKS